MWFWTSLWQGMLSNLGQKLGHHPNSFASIVLLVSNKHSSVQSIAKMVNNVSGLSSWRKGSISQPF